MSAAPDNNGGYNDCPPSGGGGGRGKKKDDDNHLSLKTAAAGRIAADTDSTTTGSTVDNSAAAAGGRGHGKLEDDDNHPSFNTTAADRIATAADSTADNSATTADSTPTESTVENLVDAAAAAPLEPSVDQIVQHIADLEMATQNSIRDSAGAYSIVPGESAMRRDINDVGNDENDSGTASDPPSEVQVYDLHNLPPNIDIIAEATLVEDDRHGSGTNDVGTFGLHWGDEPPRGGAYDDSASVAISALTDPALVAAGITESQSPPIETHDDEERGESARANIVVHAIPMDGPLACLETKSGKIAASIALLSIAVLAIGLILGLTQGNRNTPKSIVLPDNKRRTNTTVITYTTNNFCIAGVPQMFYNNYPSICTEDELRLGGTLQQAIAIALDKESNRVVRIPYHPIDVSIVNAGIVRGEIPADSPVTWEMINQTLPFSRNTIAYLELTAGDLVKVIRNAVNHVSHVVPLVHEWTAAYPYASGLRYAVDLSAENEKVSSIQVFDRFLQEWISLDTNHTKQRTYWVVTNSFIAGGGDKYLEDVEPLSLEMTDIGYNDALVSYLRSLDADWSPPSLEEMSTTSWVGL